MDFANPIRILLIEDSVTDALLTQEALGESAQFVVKHVERLSDSISVLAEGNTDIILLDLGLPDSQGLDTLRKVRQCAPEIPVIVLTANDDDDLAIQSAQERAQEYFVKGHLREGNLRRAIRHVLERSRGEEGLRQSEERLRLFVESVTEYAIIQLDPKGIVVGWNVGAERIYGYRTDEIVGKGYAIFFNVDGCGAHAPEQQLNLATTRESVRSEGWRVRNGGFEFWADCVLTSIRDRSGKLRGFSVITRDMTERRRNEQAWRLRDRAIQAVSQGILITDANQPDHPIVYASPGFERLTGYAAVEVLGKNCRFLQGPETDEKAVAAVAQALQTGVEFSTELLNYKKDGSTFWNALFITPVRNDASELTHFIGVQVDVTERKKAEQQNQRLASERDQLLERLQLQIERMPLAYVLFDSELRIIDWNPAAERMLGYRKAEMLGHEPPFDKIVPTGVRQQANELLNRIKSGDMSAHSINENLTKDGRTITCEWFNTPLFSQEREFRGMFCLAVDISERKSLEEQLRQSQKMEAIGQLAGGVAHDFNNMLSIILGYSEVLTDTGNLNPHDQSLLNEICAAGERAARLTQQLLTFSRKEVLKLRMLTVNSVIADAENMLRPLIGEDIQFITSLNSRLGLIKADAGQIQQILMNLAINARDAMPRGGTLWIETTNVDQDEIDPLHLNRDATSRYVKLTIRDTGCGMGETVKAHLFEPFFTTKEPGKGTGLGLATVYGIVKQSGGHISFDSEPGNGTTFKIYFPIVSGAPQQNTTRAPAIGALHGSETILLVEDEEMVRNLIGTFLQSRGYDVLLASNGLEALAIQEQHQKPIHLVVTDVVMPRMSGRELAEHLRTARPDLKILYMSGYTDDAIVRHGISEAEADFIQKPFSPTALVKQIRSMLDCDRLMSAQA